MLEKKDRPTRHEAEEAVRILLNYAGDDALREGLLETPKRVTKAYAEWFAGYAEDPIQHLLKTFDEIEGYQDIVLLRDIEFISTCEHHMAPIVGRAHVAYLPKGRVVGLSKIARLVEAFARRLQVQERMTQEIADCLEEGLHCLGVAVIVEAEHYCMRSRGVKKTGVDTVTRALRGQFKEAPLREEILSLMRG